MDHVEALASVRAAGLTAEADELEHAIDEALSDSPVVRISGSPTADQIADAVVAKLLDHAKVIGAKLAQRMIPEGMSPLPWTYDEATMFLRDANGRAIADTTVSSNLIATDSENGRAIVEAVNAYFAPQSPAEASTDIPATGGYPIPDYDAVGNETSRSGTEGGAS